ncbi:hypothetical protein [Leptospira idonii]|uniref:Uncharacterized protein n=1 Tax=Leptospira idonii TaxID=1193500 RepID=A0A4R9M5V1_9LEPT|nr:hypothetical protein [Leptospira idonii]TGN20579.1 hypothetical protein EHS15_03020 [Leptospira idonii]
MNITPANGANPGVVPQILPSHLGKQNGEDSSGNPVPQKQDLSVNLSEKQKEKDKETEIKPEDLLLKPTPLPLEERMSQIISAEEVKDLLSLVTRAPMEAPKDEHKVDVKR